MTAIRGPKGAITVSAMLGALMAVLDISIVNVGLSQIRASLGAALDQISWVSTSYMMANVVVIPMTGWLQRRLGFRRYYAGSLLLFTLASALCGASSSLPMLCLCRVLQGLGGGAIIPTAQSLLLLRYPEEEHGLAGALFGLGAITGPLLGPTVGGYLIDLLSWHWIFLINLPLGLLAAGLAAYAIDEPGRGAGRGEPVDGAGIALLIVAMAALQYLLEEGNREGWWESRRVVIAAMVSGVALCTFVVHELEEPHPVVELRLFQSRGYSGASALNFLLGVAAFSASYLFALYCGVVMGYASKDIGRVFLYAGAIQLLLMPLIGTAGARADGRWLVALGVLLISGGLALHGRLSPQAAFWDLVRPRFWVAVALSLLYVPLSVLGLSALPPAQRGAAAGLFNLTRELGGSIGTAGMSLLLTRRLARHGAHLSEGAAPELAAQQLAAARRLGLHGEQALGVLGLRIEGQALLLAFQDAFLLVALLFLLGLPLVLLLPGRKR